LIHVAYTNVSGQPALVDAEVQTEGKEVLALKEENEKLRTVNFEMGQHYSTLLQGLREKDKKIAELTALNAELTMKLEAAEARLKDAQTSKESTSEVPNTGEDVYMVMTPQQSDSEPVSCIL
jgi:uncharacterized protein YlxW (UPF0749 family)